MKREYYLQQIDKQLKVHSVCGLLGPRQVGKTTLANRYAREHKKRKIKFFDLENPNHLSQLENAMFALEHYIDHLIIIDEIQIRPNLFPILRVLVDREGWRSTKFLILGSASRDLLHQSAETLAGRIGYVELPPFSLEETGNSEKLWFRGGYPRSFLAESEEDSMIWRESYIATFLERDIPSLGFQVPSQTMRRFWLMLAHYHGQVLNASDLGRSLGVSHHTVRSYIDILVGTFMIRELAPWFENLGKRQVKSPKIYFRDSGILHALLGLRMQEQLWETPKLGAFWEGFAIEEVIRSQHVRNEECYFWGTHSGAELDLMVMHRGKRIGYEIKYSEAPKITTSMRIALHDLHLDHLFVIVPGNEEFPLDKKITAVGLEKYMSENFRDGVK